MNDELRLRINDLQVTLEATVKAFAALKAVASVEQPSLGNMFSANQPPLAQPMGMPTTGLPEMKMRVALWKKENCVSGTLKITKDNNVEVAAFGIILFFSKPNDNSVVMNGYIRAHNASASDDLQATSLGSVFVYKVAEGLQAQFKISASAVNDLVSWDCMLAPNQKTPGSNQPDIVAESVVKTHFYSAAVRSQMAQEPPKPESTDLFAQLMPSVASPADANVLTSPQSTDLMSFLS